MKLLVLLLSELVVMISCSVLNVQVNKRQVNGIPDEVTVNIPIEENQTVVLNLTYIAHLNSHVPVHTVNTVDNGHTTIQQEKIFKTQDNGYYQDEKKESIIHLTEVRKSGQDVSTFQLKGLIKYNGEWYDIKPANKLNRQAECMDIEHEVKKVFMNRTFGNDYVKDDTTVVQYSTDTTSRLTKLTRHTRQTTTTQHKVVIDVAAVVDHSSFRRFMRESSHDRVQAINKIQQHYTLILHGVDLIYRGINSTILSIKVKLVKIIIIENYTSFKLPHTGLGSKKVNGVELLNRLSQFVKSNNLTDSSDHVMLFIGLDLWLSVGYMDLDLLGIARLSSLCNTNGSSISIVEDMFENYVIWTAAHELAHSVSAHHDGDRNSCSYKEHNVMAASYEDEKNDTVLHPWRFSQCSVDYFSEYITQLLETQHGENCLTGSFPVTSNIPNITDIFFGQFFPPREQCRNTYGKGSYHCKVGYNTSDICTAMYCYDPERLGCFPQIALSGTRCSDNKICRLGKCIENDHDL